MTNPVYGILSKEEFFKLHAMPHGAAAKEIRKKDPLWGRTSGNADDMRPYKIKATATCTIYQTESQTFTVSACSEEQAKEIAGELADNHHWNNLDENPDEISMDVVS